MLDQYVQDEFNNKLRSVIPIYTYTGQPFEDPINNGIETKKGSEAFYAKLPDLSNYKDTSYGYVFFGGIAGRKQLPGYVLVILCNNKRQFKKEAVMWVDRNYNLDLTDDGAPDTLFENKPLKDLVFKNPANANATYTVAISRFPTGGKTPLYLTMMNDYHRENSGKKKFDGILYSLGEYRINTIGGDFKSERDSFRIGIKDNNCNGFYNDEGVDYLLIGRYKEEILPDIRTEIKKDLKGTYFEHNGIRYNVKEINPLGNYILIEEELNTAPVSYLRIGKKIPKFKFKTIEHQPRNLSIKKFKRKPTYIYVWKTDQPNLKEDTATLRIIQSQFGHKINIITLNYGETPKQLMYFYGRGRINWLMGQSTAAINRTLGVDNYPMGILTRKRLRVKQLKISPKELLILLQNNQI